MNYHVNFQSVLSETTLTFGIHSVCQYLESAQDDSLKMFIKQAEKGDCLIVVTLFS